MRSKLKYSSALAAAAFALACSAPGAYASSFASSSAGTKTYNAQTVAINSFAAMLPNFPTLFYHSDTGQGGALAGTWTIVWTTTGTGTTFTGSLGAANVATAGCGAAAVSAGPTVSGNTITLVMTSPAGGVPAGCSVFLFAPGAPFPAALGVSVAGLTNLAPATGAAAGTSNDNPTAVFGTVNTTTGQPAGALGLGTLQDVITVAVTTDSAGPATDIDASPQIAMSLNSVNGWSIFTSGAGLLVDLTGAGGSTPGLQFQKISNGVLSTTTAGSLGTITINNLDTLPGGLPILDARFANKCCQNSANTFQGNVPIPGEVFNVTVSGDFQTIVAAYLRTGNNVTNSPTTPTVNGATPQVEQNPNANPFSSVCSGAPGTGDIVSTPAPTAAGFTQLQFAIPNSANSVNGNVNVNQLQYAVCVQTNNTNLIADTFTNGPGNSSGAGGVVASGVTTTISVQVPGIAVPIGIAGFTNAHLGWDIAYAGTKAIFPNVFNASTGRPSSFRLVNTGLGTFPMYAILQKDGGVPITIPGSFAAMTPFSAFFVVADSIAFQGGQTLGLNNTITLLTPAPPGALQISHFLNDPNGDIVLTLPGL